MVSFTELSSRLDSKELISLLNHLYSQFDTAASLNGCLKVTTIGDGKFKAEQISSIFFKFLLGN